MPKRNVDLYYAYQESPPYIYHAFEAVERGTGVDGDAVKQRLAELLDTTPNSDDFHYDVMSIDIPEQAPMPVIRRPMPVTCLDAQYEYKCPSCGRKLIPNAGYNYCPECGTHLEWP